MEYPRLLALDWTRQYGSWPVETEGECLWYQKGVLVDEKGWRCAVWSRPFGSAFSPLDGRLRAHARLASLFWRLCRDFFPFSLILSDPSIVL